MLIVAERPRRKRRIEAPNPRERTRTTDSPAMIPPRAAQAGRVRSRSVSGRASGRRVVVTARDRGVQVPRSTCASVVVSVPCVDFRGWGRAPRQLRAAMCEEAIEGLFPTPSNRAGFMCCLPASRVPRGARPAAGPCSLPSPAYRVGIHASGECASQGLVAARERSPE